MEVGQTNFQNKLYEPTRTANDITDGMTKKVVRLTGISPSIRLKISLFVFGGFAKHFTDLKKQALAGYLRITSS